MESKMNRFVSELLLCVLMASDLFFDNWHFDFAMTYVCNYCLLMTIIRGEQNELLCIWCTFCCCCLHFFAGKCCMVQQVLCRRKFNLGISNFLGLHRLVLYPNSNIFISISLYWSINKCVHAGNKDWDESSIKSQICRSWRVINWNSWYKSIDLISPFSSIKIGFLILWSRSNSMIDLLSS